MKTILFGTLLVSALLLTSPQRAQNSLASPSPKMVAPGAESTVRRFVEAFNKHDVAAMAALVSDDVQWLNVKESRVEIETDGKAALEKGRANYFHSCPTCRSALESVMVAGNYVTLYERAMWEAKSGPRAQRSLAVYEVREGLIRRAWYYPAEQTDVANGTHASDQATVSVLRWNAAMPPLPQASGVLQFTTQQGRFVGKAVKLEFVVRWLSYLLSEPIVDETGLTESYDLEFEWDPAGKAEAIIAAMQKRGFVITKEARARNFPVITPRR